MNQETIRLVGTYFAQGLIIIAAILLACGLFWHLCNMVNDRFDPHRIRR